ncbi:MAG: DUF805 domain-containing protein [Actinobacteria bacterium]|nr:DUF805 domain-containing protein [Actinomycetota bacterium]
MSNLTPPPYPPSQPAAGAGAAPEHGPYTFVEAIKVGFRKYATFSGRARASEYWYWGLFVTLVNIAVGGATGFQDVSTAASGTVSFDSGLSNLVTVALFLPGLAVTVRRLHDTNRSGWWLLLPGGLTTLSIILFIGAFGTGFVGALSDNSDSQAFAGAAIGFAIAGGIVGIGAFATWILMVVWTVSDGGPNVPNKYGVRD